MVISLIAFAVVSAPESEPINHTIAPVGGGDYLVYQITGSFKLIKLWYIFVIKMAESSVT